MSRYPDFYLRQYLHYYESQHDCIFDFARKQFQYIKKIFSWSREGNRIKISCETNETQKVFVQIYFCDSNVFRFLMSVRNSIFDRKTTIINEKKWSEVNLKSSEDTDNIFIETSSMKIKISKKPWGFQVYNKDNEPICREYIDGLQKPSFPIYPLGFYKEKDVIWTYETMCLQPDEHFYGLGEKFSGLDKRGQRIVSWNVDTTLVSSERAYKNIPFFMSTKGYAIFINSSQRIVYEMGSDSFVSYSFAVKEPYLDYYFIYAPKFKDILKRYTEMTGKAPVPPKWSFGLWMSRASYRNREEVEEICNHLRKHQIPCDVIHIDPAWMRKGHWCDFEWNREAFPHPQQMIQGLKNKGFKLSLWEQPYVPVITEMFREGEKKSYFVKNKWGKTYIIMDFEKNPVAIVDFSNPEAVIWYQQKHRVLLQMGVDVFKTDMGEAIPEDALFSNGMTGAEMHNIYPLFYHRVVYEVSKKYSPKNALIWGRSGYAGIQKYPLVWSGDSYTSFSDMACVLRGGLSLSLSGVPFWSHDIGGFQGSSPSPQLYIRWAQFGLFTSHARCHGISPREPWAYGKKALEIFKKYVQLRYRLIPYIYSYAHIAAQTGLPVIRPLVLEYQDDSNTFSIDLEYLFGSELLIAPVFNERNKCNIYLPKGKWIDYWTHSEYLGPQNIEYYASLETLPIFVRVNSIIVMGPVMNFIGEKSFNPLTLDIYLDTKANFTFYDDEEIIEFQAAKEEKCIALKITPCRKDYVILLNRIKESIMAIEQNGIRVSQCHSRENLASAREGWWFNREANQLIIKIAASGPTTLKIKSK